MNPALLAAMPEGWRRDPNADPDPIPCPTCGRPFAWERLRKMYPAWMEEFAVRYDAVGDVDGRKLGAPSLELRMALARMLPDSRILTPWIAGALGADQWRSVRYTMSGRAVLFAKRVTNHEEDRDPDRWLAHVDHGTGRGLEKLDVKLYSKPRAMAMADMYAIRNGWYPIGVGTDALRAALEQP